MSQYPHLHRYRTRHVRQREQRMSRIDGLLFLLVCTFLMVSACLWSIKVDDNLQSYAIEKNSH